MSWYIRGMWTVALGLIFLAQSANAQLIQNLREKVDQARNECNKYYLKWQGSRIGEEMATAKLIGKLRSKAVRDLSRDSVVQEWIKSHRVYISVTTSPQRLPYLHYVLESLDLSAVEAVYVSLPERFGRTGQEYLIPDNLFVNSKIKVLRPKIDEGPVSKLTTALEFLQKNDNEAFLITVDDDTAYSRAMVNEMIYAAAHFPKTVLSGKGQTYDYYGIQNFPKSKGQKSSRRSLGNLALKPIDVVAGFATVGYPVKLVPLGVLRDYANRSLDAFVSDDMTISLALEHEKVPRYRLSSPYFSIADVHQLFYGYGGDALHRGAGFSTAQAPKDVNNLKYQKTFDLMKGDVF